jgi:predicted RNase H-like HicB family nuclease
LSFLPNEILIDKHDEQDYFTLYYLSTQEHRMKTYVFRVVIEPDEDMLTAYCPALKGCVTWGKTEAEALRNIRDAVEAYIEDMLETGDPLPDDVPEEVHTLSTLAISVTV